jgi:hypothetical protein
MDDAVHCRANAGRSRNGSSASLKLAAWIGGDRGPFWGPGLPWRVSRGRVKVSEGEEEVTGSAVVF